jgi:dTDP-4-amino-4,6-dideoxygalactose transaminase
MSMGGVPLCDVLGQYRELEPQLLEAVRRVLASGQVILGPEVVALEREIAAYCGAGHAVGCASGTDALLLALHALDIGPGTEVILPPFTFFATVGAICRTGARPVFADIDPLTYNLDPFQVENKITPRTRAILPVHLYGQCADMEPLWQIAERHNLAIIEDAAQALGAEYQGNRAGTLGAIGCFSFYPTKNLGAWGDGGAIVTDNRELAAQLLLRRSHGEGTRHRHELVAGTDRLDALQAAILRVTLERLDEANQLRREAGDELRKGISGATTVAPALTSAEGDHVFHLFVVRSQERDALRRHLDSLGISNAIHYPTPIHLQPAYADFGMPAGSLPTAERLAVESCSLPIFPTIETAQNERIAAAVASFTG